MPILPQMCDDFTWNDESYGENVDKSVEKNVHSFGIFGGKQVADGRECVAIEQISDLGRRRAAADVAQRPGS